MMNPYAMSPYKILSIFQETDIDYTFKIAYSGKLVGGQFFQVSVPGVGEGPISISDFTEDTVDLTIRKVGTLTNAIFKLKAGDSLYMRGPYGNGFDLSHYEGKNLVVIAGGTGLAPVKHVVAHFGEKAAKGNLTSNHTANPSTNQGSNLQLLAGFKSSKDILFKDTLKKWSEQFETIVTIDKEEEGWQGPTGLVTTFLDQLNLSPMENTHVIVVGPPIMMKFTTLGLLKLGLPEDQLWVSFERNMSCGIGKCGHCKIDETYVCLDGPVFSYGKAKFLLD